MSETRERSESALAEEINVHRFLKKYKLLELESIFIARNITIESLFEYNDYILEAFAKILNLERKQQKKLIKGINKLRPYEASSFVSQLNNHSKSNKHHSHSHSHKKSFLNEHKKIKKEFKKKHIKKKKKKKKPNIRSESRGVISINTNHLKTRKKDKIIRAKTPTINTYINLKHNRTKSYTSTSNNQHESEVHLRPLKNNDSQDEYLRKKRQEIRRLKDKRKMEKKLGKRKQPKKIWSSNATHDSSVKLKPLKHDDSRLERKRKEIRQLKSKKKKHRKTGSTASLFNNPHETTQISHQMSNEQLKELQRAQREMREYENLLKKHDRMLTTEDSFDDDDDDDLTDSDADITESDIDSKISDVGSVIIRNPSSTKKSHINDTSGNIDLVDDVNEHNNIDTNDDETNHNNNDNNSNDVNGKITPKTNGVSNGNSNGNSNGISNGISNGNGNITQTNGNITDNPGNSGNSGSATPASIDDDSDDDDDNSEVSYTPSEGDNDDDDIKSNNSN